MMRIQITAGGIYGADGKEVAIGTELTVKKKPTAWAGRYTVLEGDEAKPKGGKKAVTNPAKDAAKYEAKPKGDAFVITDADGGEHGAALSEADATAFNSLSDEDKDAFVVEHVKG